MIGVDSGQILGVLIALLLFGVYFNQFVAWLERKRYTEGFLSLIVATGVGGTLIGLAILSIEAAALALACFAASGTPMIVGSIVRYVRAREAAQKRMRYEAIAHGDDSERLA